MSGEAKARWPLLVGGVALAVHLGCLANGFALDDVPLVRDNLAVRSFAHVPALFLEPYWNVPGESYGLYRPLTIASFAINRALAGPEPWGFHLANVLLHAAAAALAWMAIRGAGTHYGGALAGAGLFAVLPVHTEAVANIAGRAELLAAVLVLAAWLAHRRARAGGSPRTIAGAAGLYLAAMLAKESAVLAPLLFACEDALAAREGGAGDRRSIATRYGAYAASLGVALALRWAALGTHQTAESAVFLDNPAAAAGTVTRVLTALWVQTKLLALCAWPRTLVSDYSFDAIPLVRSLGDPRALAGLATAVSVGGAIVWGWRHSRPVAISALTWTIFAAPSSNLFVPAGTIMGERLAYLPSLGACLIVGHLGAAAVARAAEPAARRRRGWAVGAITVLLASAMALRTLARVPAWKDNLTLATGDVVLEPRSAKLQAGAGIFLAAAGRSAEAEDHFLRALEIYPDYAQIHYNLAVLLARRGDDAGDEQHLRRAIAIAPGAPQPYKALAELLDRSGRQAEAEQVRATTPR